MGVMLSCCAADAACCAGKGAIKACGLVIPSNKSTSAKFMYAFGIIMVTIISFILHTWGEKIVKWIPGALTESCGGNCFQFFAPFKASFALVLLHALLCLLLLGVSRPDTARSCLQTGFWPIKTLIFLGVFVGAFFMPNSAFEGFWVASVVFSVLFIIVQAILLVDFAYNMAEKIVSKYEETGSAVYKYMLISITFLLNALFIAATVYFYLRFTDSRSKAFISVNLILGIVVQVCSILPAVQEANPRSGLFQSAILVGYTTFVTGTALMYRPFSVPQDPSAYDEFMLYAGLIITFVSLAYGAYSAGTSSGKIVISSSEGEEADEDAGGEYNYSFFHFIFLSAACYVALLLTYWQKPYLDAENVYKFSYNDGPVWVKICTSWVVYLLFSWTLLAPIMFPNRDFGV